MRFALVFLVACSTSLDPALPRTPDGEPPPTSDADAAPSASDDASVPDTASPPPPCTGPVLWFRDADGDGYGAAGTAPRALCGDTAGFVENALDCADEDARAHPGATADGTPIVGVHAGPSFDFDCDGRETPTWTELATCSTPPCTLVARAWFDHVPACGAPGVVISDCHSARTVCQPTIEPTQRVQTCR